ncbi:MAG: hypothetical protein HW418_4192 [Anaerolineales bacterium]|nr:hypothetical protein [Anaerolineales bacterium]
MNVSPQDADLFFKLLWAVQFYVNRRQQIIPGVKSVAAFRKLPAEEKMKVREALYRHPEWLNDFAAENPEGFLPEELQIVRSWKHHISGDFYIVRFLKRHAIFVSAKGSKVYAVLGLYDSLEEVLGGWPPPVYVQAVLLPFKGVIIYDGLLMSQNIFFGPGIRGDLNETYQRAKQNGAILESLEPGAPAPRKPARKKPARDWGPALDHIVEAAEQLRQADTAIQTRAFSLLKASARLAQAAARAPDNLDELYQLGRNVSRALKQMETVLDRAGWSE